MKNTRRTSTFRTKALVKTLKTKFSFYSLVGCIAINAKLSYHILALTSQDSLLIAVNAKLNFAD